MAAIFRPSANLWMKLAMLSAAALVVGGCGWWWMAPRTDWARGVGFVVGQPVQFSHQHHVDGLGIGCQTCHSHVEVGSNAGLPPTHTCMTCHSQIWTNAKVLAPVRESFARKTPIHWNRVHRVAQYVYFDHSIHVAKGVGCSECHGAMTEMNLTRQATPMTMGWCLDCHRNPGPHLRPETAIYDTAWTPADDPLKADRLAKARFYMAHYQVDARHLSDCTTCHR